MNTKIDRDQAQLYRSGAGQGTVLVKDSQAVNQNIQQIGRGLKVVSGCQTLMRPAANLAEVQAHARMVLPIGPAKKGVQVTRVARLLLKGNLQTGPSLRRHGPGLGRCSLCMPLGTLQERQRPGRLPARLPSCQARLNPPCAAQTQLTLQQSQTAWSHRHAMCPLPSMLCFLRRLSRHQAQTAAGQQTQL